MNSEEQTTGDFPRSYVRIWKTLQADCPIRAYANEQL